MRDKKEGNEKKNGWQKEGKNGGKKNYAGTLEFGRIKWKK